MRKINLLSNSFFLFSSAAMVQSGADSKDAWLYEHSHSYTKLGNIETPIESDTTTLTTRKTSCDRRSKCR